MVEEIELVSSEPVHARRIRILELLLVVAVAFGPALISAAYHEFHTRADAQENKDQILQTLLGIVEELIALAVLRYVLFRQGRQFKDLGLSFGPKDLLRSAPVFTAAMFAYGLIYVFLGLLYKIATGHPIPRSEHSLSYAAFGLNLGTVLLMVINPFYEELIVRAFVITEVSALARSTMLAVLVSVGVQSSYHIYQGLQRTIAVSAAFLIYSLYYVRYKRVMPVILAHMYTDLIALFYYSRHY